MSDRVITTTIDIKGNINNLQDAIKKAKEGLNELSTSKSMKSANADLFRDFEQTLKRMTELTEDNKLSVVDEKEMKKTTDHFLSLWHKLETTLNNSDLGTKPLQKYSTALEKLETLNKSLRKDTKDLAKANTEAIDKEIAAQKQLNEVTAKLDKIKAASKNEKAAHTQYANAKQEVENLKKNKASVEELAAAQDKLNRKTDIWKDKQNILQQVLAETGNKSKSASKAINDLTGEQKNAIQVHTEATQKVKDTAEAYTGALTTALKEAKSALSSINWSELGVDLNSIDSIEKLEEEISNLKKRGLEGAADELTKLRNAFNSTAPAAEETAKAVDKCSDSLKELTDTQKEIESLTNRVKQFFSIGNAIMLFRRAIRSAYNEVKELDKVMTQAAVVTEFSVGDFWLKLPEYTARAKQLGLTIQDVYEADTLYYQQGLKTNEVMAVSNETMKMARIAGLETAEATDRMTNALRGFNMEISEANAQNINDVYSNLAARTASNVQEISVAMTKVASLAHSANMSFENTAAFLSQIIETTRESAETAGTALKTVVARFSEVKNLYTKGQLLGQDEEGQEIDVNRVASALRSAGINLNEYLTGAKGLDQIFIELSAKWNQLDIVQQRYIATMAAGSRQQSRFIALMQDYNRMTELTTMANNSAGASNAQFEKTLESLETKLNRLKDTWYEFLFGIIDNSVIKGLVDVLTELLQAINKLSNATGPFQGFTKTLLAIGTFKLGKGVFNKLFNDIAERFVKGGEKASKEFGQGFTKNFGKIKNIFTKKFWTCVQIDPEILKQNENAINQLLVSSKAITEETNKGTAAQLLYEETLKSCGLTDLQFSNIQKMGLSVQQQAILLDGSEASSKALNALSTKGEITEEQKLLVQKALENKASQAGIFQRMAEIATRALNVLGINAEVVATKQEIIAQKALQKESEKTTAKMIISLGWIGLIIAAIAFLVAGIIALIAWQAKVAKDNSFAGKLEKNNELIKDLTEVTSEATNSVSELSDAINSIDDYNNKFDGLIRGTKEWNDALYESNQEVLDLLEKYPQLTVTNAGGRLVLNSAQLQKVLNEQQQLALNSSVALNAARVEQTKLEAGAILEAAGRENQWIKGNDFLDNMVKTIANSVVGGPIANVVSDILKKTWKQDREEVNYLTNLISQGKLSVDQLTLEDKVWTNELKDYKDTFEKYQNEFVKFTNKYNEYTQQQLSQLLIIAANTANKVTNDEGEQRLYTALGKSVDYKGQAGRNYLLLTEAEKKAAYAEAMGSEYHYDKLNDKLTNANGEVKWDDIKGRAKDLYISNESTRLLEEYYRNLNIDIYKNATAEQKEAILKFFEGEQLNSFELSFVKSISEDLIKLLPEYIWGRWITDAKTGEKTWQKSTVTQATLDSARNSGDSEWYGILLDVFNAQRILENTKNNLANTSKDEVWGKVGGIDILKSQYANYLKNTFGEEDFRFGSLDKWVKNNKDNFSESFLSALIGSDWNSEEFDPFKLLLSEDFKDINDYEKAIDKLQELSKLMARDFVNSLNLSTESVRAWSTNLNNAITGELDKSNISKEIYNNIAGMIPATIREQYFQQTGEDTYSFLGTQAEFINFLKTFATLIKDMVSEGAAGKEGSVSNLISAISQGTLTTEQLAYVTGRSKSNSDLTNATVKAIKAEAGQYKELTAELKDYNDKIITTEELLTAINKIYASQQFERNLKLWDEYIKELEDADHESEEFNESLQDLALQAGLDFKWLKENYDTFVAAIGGNENALKSLQDAFIITLGLDTQPFEDGLLDLNDLMGVSAEAFQKLVDSGMFDVVVNEGTIDAKFPFITYDPSGKIIQDTLTQEGKVQYLTLKKKSTENLSNITSKAGTGSKSSTKSSNWLTGLDKYYNLTAAINEQLRQREKLEREYDRLLERREGTYDQLKKSLLDQQASLRREIDLQHQLSTGRQEQLKNAANEKIQWGEGYSTYAAVGASNYARWDEQNHQVVINWDAIHNVTDEDLGGAIEDYISKLEEYADGWNETEKTIEDMEDELYEINQRGKDSYLELQERVIDALKQQRQLEIDELSDINEQVNNMNSEIISGIQEQIELERQIRDNTKKEEEISDLENRLEYLRRDTSGANAVAIKETEEQLEQKRQEYTDSLIDQTINQMQDDNEKAQEQREEQIRLMREQLDWYSEHGGFIDEMYRLINSSVSEDGTLIGGSKLVDLFKTTEAFQFMTEEGQMKWLDEMIKQWKEAMVGEGSFQMDRAIQAGQITSDQNIQKKNLIYNSDGTWSDENGTKYNAVWNSATKMFDIQTVDNGPKITTNSVGDTVPTGSSNPGGPSPSKEPKSYDIVDASGNTVQSFGTLEEAQQELELQQNMKKNAPNFKGYSDILQAAAMINSKDTGTAEFKNVWTRLEDKQVQTERFFKKVGYNIAKQAPLYQIQQEAIDSLKENYKKWQEIVYKWKVEPRYLSGGLNTSTGPAWLDGTASKPEYVLNARDTQVYLTLTNLLNKLLSNSSSVPSGSGDNYFNIDINVDELGSDYDVDQLFERLKTEIVDDAMYRNVNVINLKR